MLLNPDTNLHSFIASKLSSNVTIAEVDMLKKNNIKSFPSLLIACDAKITQTTPPTTKSKLGDC